MTVLPSISPLCDPIREEQEYGGVRLRTTATVAGARIAVVVDIGFGDAVASGIEIIGYPVLLDLPASKLRADARKTLMAEKFQAMIVLGRANSRVKDFYDIWILSRTFRFEGDRLARAIAACPTAAAGWHSEKRGIVTGWLGKSDILPIEVSLIRTYEPDRRSRAT